MSLGTDFDPTYDITDEERAIIASMIEEEERLKQMGLGPGATIDYSGVMSDDRPPPLGPGGNDNNRPMEVTMRLAGVPTVPGPSRPQPDIADRVLEKICQTNAAEDWEKKLREKQYVIDITDDEDHRPLEVRLKALNAEREADQQRLIHANSYRHAQLRQFMETNPVIHLLNQDSNVEETEEMVEEPVPSASSILTSPVRLVRQSSYYQSSKPSSNINPLLLLSEQIPVTRTKIERRPPDISRSSYGFTYMIQYDGLEISEVQPFCFQWVGEILRISGILSLQKSAIIHKEQNLKSYEKECRVCLLSSMALFHPVSPRLSSPQNPHSQNGDIFFYQIESEFLDKPIPVAYQTNREFGTFIYSIGYDEIRSEYYLHFYRSVNDFPHNSLTYHQLLWGENESILVSIDTSVHLVFDPHRDF